MKTTQEKVAETILEKPMTVMIGGEAYTVAPPSTATLIEVSAEVSHLPEYKQSGAVIIDEVLRIAKDCRPLGNILAILILGAKGLKEHRKVPKKRFLWHVTEWQDQIVDRKKELADFILNELPPKEVQNITVKILATLQVSDFFGFSTSLMEINMTAAPTEKTKKEVEKTTQSGR